MAETQRYSHSDIKRYLQHKMLPQEMHEFEKALMNDPFLADALEGFALSDQSVAESHLAAIEDVLTNQRQAAKVVQLSVRKTTWWKVASIILVIISAAAITYSVLFNERTKENAIVSTTPEAFKNEKDSLGPVNKPLAQVEALPTQGEVSHNASPVVHDQAHSTVASQKPFPPLAIQKPDSAVATSIAASPTEINDVAMAKEMKPAAENESKGKQTPQGEAMAFSAKKAFTISATSNEKGRLSLQARDSVVDVHVNSKGYGAATTTINGGKSEQKPTEKEDELSLAEVVVSNMVKKKNRALSGVRLDTTVEAEPVGGWKNFKQYLNQQIDSLKATDHYEDLDEDIVLEFSIDKEGRPTDIKTPADVDGLIAEKAKKIITNGPKWKSRKKEKKVEVIIGF